jgi:transcriptional regulator with XRE-family HTH domain
MGHTRRPKRLAGKLLRIREALGLSQQEVAERLGHEMTNKNISKYERARSVPPIEVVLAYARIANVIMEQIVDDDLDLLPELTTTFHAVP